MEVFSGEYIEIYLFLLIYYRVWVDHERNPTDGQVREPKARSNLSEDLSQGRAIYAECKVRGTRGEGRWAQREYLLEE